MSFDIDTAALERSATKFKPFVALEELKGSCEGDEVLAQLLEEVCQGALRYTESVCQFEQIRLKHQGKFDENGEREEIEKVRGSSHDTFISDVNVLSRTLAKKGKDNRWRDKLGDDRARFGRLALTLSFEIIKSKGGNV